MTYHKMQAAKVSIRQFRPSDHAAVCELFRVGMYANYRRLVTDSLQLPHVASACLLPPVACAALLSARGRLCSTLGVTSVVLAGAALPCAAAFMVWRMIEGYIRYSLGSDLADIPTHYLTDPGNNFWVAEMDGQVVGSVALQRREGGRAELRRLSVLPHVRRAGVGTLLVQHLIQYAQQQGCKEVYLVTTSAQRQAIALYHKNGWRTTKVESNGMGIFHHLSLDVEPSAASLGLAA